MLTRPTALTVIAWAGVAVGALAIASATMGLVAWYSMGSMKFAPTTPSEEPWPFALLFRYFGPLASCQVIVGAVILAAGCALFRLRRWAAVVLEGAAWCYLLYSFLFTVVFIRYAMTSAAEHAITPEQRSTLLFIVGGAVFVFLFWGTPLVATLVALRRPSHRAVLR